MENCQHVVETLTLITGSKGAFEVRVNNDLLYSKKQLGRHAEPGEILQLFTHLVGPDTPRYPG